MLIKWIICQVSSTQKAAFSEAQAKWSLLNQSEGFIAQFGGFDIKHANIACICGIWLNKTCLDQFMDDTHDLIVEKNDQERTYQSIEISYLMSDLSIQALRELVQENKHLDVYEISSTNYNLGDRNGFLAKNNQNFYFKFNKSRKENTNYLDCKLLHNIELDQNWTVLSE